MKWLLGVIFALCSSIALSDPVVVTDRYGVKHGTGLVKGISQGLKIFKNPTPQPLPEAFDSRDTGGISPVKDQGSCGSCWAHAIAENLEDAVLHSGSPGVDLAPQQMVSCDDDAAGCGGGDMGDAQYVVDKGLALEKDYPYKASDTRCKKPLPKIAAKASSWAYVGAPGRKPKTDEVKQAVYAQGSVFVTVAAGGSDWDGREVMTQCRNGGSNHMVEIVGWTAKGQWIMRNSWGTDWGKDGYALMPYGCDNIAEEAAFVVYTP